MSGDDDEFRFGPADVGPAGDGDAAEFDPVPAVIGLAVGVGGLLFLAEPFVDPLAVGGTRLPVVFLSVVIVAAEQQPDGDDDNRQEGDRQPRPAERQRIDERLREKEYPADADREADDRRHRVELRGGVAVAGRADVGGIDSELAVVVAAHSFR